LTDFAITTDVIAAMREHFSERGMVLVASTAARVNFWARLIQSLGVPHAGFSSECAILDLDACATRKA
jgi:alkylhydroperoxidase family enzyme